MCFGSWANSANLGLSADSLFRVLQDWMARVGSEGALAARELPETLDPAIRDQLRALGYTQ